MKKTIMIQRHGIMGSSSFTTNSASKSSMYILSVQRRAQSYGLDAISLLTNGRVISLHAAVCVDGTFPELWAWPIINNKHRLGHDFSIYFTH